MKNLLFSLFCVIILSGTVQAQWTTSGSNIYNSNTGNVGVGTTAPGTALDVLAASTIAGIRSGNSTALGAGSGGAFLAVAPSIPSAADQRIGLFALGAISSGTSYKYAAYISGYSSEAWSASANGSYLTFSTIPNGTTSISEKMRIDNAGNVSIGTTNPHGFKLAVNGNAIAISMTVQAYANWPDYVFRTDYKLPALSEIKSYIDQNKHLPELPSAAEVAKNGINLGEMNKALVKKVEELTLYLIDQQKLVQQQKTDIQLQAAISKQLQERLDKLESLIGQKAK